ncbi:MAG: glycine cleavage system aminomethyltransferase GcvT [Thiohalobacterales bacterium]|nr:glycine cleavage system aminomethyltransferase GcvT [Thiohalobacterales bacterium]
MGNKTPLYDEHLADGGKLVDFAGWDMPLNYGSQIEEHNNVRTDAGMFDVSHMTVVDLTGARTREFLRYLLANNVDRLQESGKALYSCMLKEDGGVIDDLIVYFIRDDFFRMVVNAGTRDKDLAWLQQQAAAFDITVTERPELAMIAIQGPNAREKTLPLLSDSARAFAAQLKPFYGEFDGDWFIARTGYTGEDGFEIILPAADAPAFWSGLRAAGAKQKLVGLLLEDRGVLRNHQKVIAGGGEGEVTSGSFSPTLQRAIAFARVPKETGNSCQVDIRGKLLNARVVKPPFVRNGEAQIEL